MEKGFVDMINIHVKMDIASATEFTHVLREKRNHELHHEKLTGIPDIVREQDLLQYWEGHGFAQYKHNFVYRNVFFGISHRSDKYEAYTSCKVEFNPNKTSIEYNPYLVWFLQYAFNNFAYTKIRSVDFAWDLKVNINNIIIDKARKRDMNKVKTTWYAGARNSGLKIYDKKLEMLETAKKKKFVGKEYTPDWYKEIEKQELTRYEIRMPVDVMLYEVMLGTYKFEFNSFPTIYIVNNLDNLDPVDKCVILGLIQEPDLLGQFSRRKKEKYREVLQSQQAFQPKSPEVDKIFKLFCKNLLTTVENCDTIKLGNITQSYLDLEDNYITNVEGLYKNNY